MGIRLNTASEIFKRMKIGSIPKANEKKENGEEMSLKAIERTTAKIKLAEGPANDIKAESLWGFLRLYGSNGTGLAQPKGKGRYPKAVRIAVIKSSVVPAGS